MLKPQEQNAGLSRKPLAIAALLLIVWLAMLLVGGSEPERQILMSAYAGHRPWAPLALFVTRLGDWEVLVALTFFGCGWLLLRRQWRLAGMLLGSTLAARLVVGVQKIAFARIRPAENEHLIQVQTLSFPSGHAANSMIVYVLLAAFLIRDPRQRRVAIAAAVVLSLLIGISRTMLAVHWPSDVVGGWAFGTLWVIAVIYWARPQFAPAITTGVLQR